MINLSQIVTIARRDLIRNLRQKNQILGAIARPVIWIFFLGSGLGSGFTGLPLGFSYQQYTFPGILAMNILFSGIMSGASILWDREFGFLKEIRIAPVSRSSILGGKVLAGTVLATFNGLIVFAFFPLLGIRMTIVKALATMFFMLLTAVSVTSVGVLLASIVKTIEGFGTVNNLIAMPLFALSGAMYPLGNAPEWLRYIAFLNPFTFAVNLLRGSILGVNGDPTVDLAEIILFTVIVLFLSAHLIKT
ncbi:MAG: ABC transporter permease [Rectinemataceae bacterium]|nr:ABC transporter permease [Rectinemataceae bacterium]